MRDFAVEFVFDFMVILTDVTMIDSLDEESIIEVAKDNLLNEYGIVIESLYPRDVIIHDKNYGYIPPNQVIGVQ